MKKLILATFTGLFLFSCSTEELDIQDSSINEVNVEATTCTAGPDNSINLTIAQIDANYNSVSRLQVLFNSLLPKSVRGTGAFSPSIQDLAVAYVNASDKLGAYTSTYVVEQDNCIDSAEITVNVIEECNVDAGIDNLSTVLTLSEVANNYNSVSRLEVLYKELIADGVNTTGTFSPSIEQIAVMYTNAEDKTGVYSTTYTVGSGTCTDSAELAVTVVEDECSFNAGMDNSITLTTTQIQERYNSVSRLKTLYTKLLSDGVSSNGTWSPSIEELAKRYINANDKSGTYTSTYTLTNGVCSDSADISIVVR